MSHGVIKVPHTQMQEFVNSALHPDPAEMARRNAFLKKISKETPYRREGTSLVCDMPDINIAKILSEN